VLFSYRILDTDSDVLTMLRDTVFVALARMNSIAEGAVTGSRGKSFAHSAFRL